MATADKISDLTVLIVDANAHHRAIVSEILRAAGVTRISTAENATDALEEMRVWRPHAVILEWALTPIDGIELTRRIRSGANDVDRTVPLIMLTARNTVADVETARRAGVHEYAIKPVSTGALLTRIEAAALRPRRFVDSPVYVGPCRRRKKVDAYEGPRRRLADPVSAESQRVTAAASVTRILKLAARFDPSDRNQVRAVYDSAKSARIVAAEIGDHPLDRAADSLVRYIEGMGATDRLDCEIVQTHVGAMARLVALPNDQTEAREQVARGLEAVVQKKMRASNAT